MMVIEATGGSFLESASAIFVSAPALLALVPLINAVGGNAGSIVGSRMATALHLGSVKGVMDREVVENMTITGSMAIVAKLISASFILLFLPVIGMATGVNAVKFLSITFIAAIIVLSSVIPSAVITSILAFRYGKSPDDFTIPVVSTVGDIMGIISLIIAIKMVGL
jgi:mgtE-like transporter